MEQNRIHQDAFAATGGEASVGVGIARIIVKHAVGTNFADSNLSGNNVSINTGVGNFDIANPVNAQMQADRQSKLNGSNYVQRKLLAWKSSLINDTAKNTGLYNFDFTFGLAIGDAATYGLASGTVAVLPTTIKKFGTINADFVNTGITANNNLSINAADMTVTRSDNRAFSFATGGTVQVVNADSINESDIAVNFKGNKGGEIKANNIEVTTLNKVNQTVETDEHSASIFVNVPVEFTETKDTSRSAINVDKNYTFEGEKLLMSAANKPVLFADSLQNPYFAGTQLAYFGTLAKADSRAEINIGDGNAFNAGEVTFEAQIGEKETPTAKVDHSSVKILEVQASDFTSNAKAETNTSAKINVGNVEYDDSDVVINAENNAWRHVKTKSLQIIGGFEYGGGGSTNGIARGTDTAQVSAGGGTVNSLDINAAVNSYADNYAHSIAPVSIIEAANKAQARNYFGGYANAKLSGTWKSAGNISVNVSNEDGLDSMSEAGGVQVVGFEGMDFEVKIGKLNDSNELTGAANTGVTIADGTKIDAANFTINATNTINTQKNKKYGANIDAWLTPVLGGAWAKSEENIKRTTSIDIGKNVNVTTTGEQIYEAGTQTQLDNTAIGITWGAIGGGRVTASTVGDFANTVKVGTGSKFTTTDTGDLTFATYDNILSNVYSQSNYKGAIGTDLVSNAVNKVTRKNTVDIAQGTKLNSANDLNLYAGATDEGHLSELISSTTSEASNGSLAISTSPQIDITADSTNELKINGTAKAKADLNLIADKGTENVTKRAVKYSFGEESDKGQIPVRRTVEDAKYFKYSNKANSAIELNGAATAGDGNNVEVKISGTAPRSDKPTYEVKFTDGNGKALAGYAATTGSFNYAQTLAARWNELQELIGIYTAKTGNVTIAQYAGYVQELALLENKMARLGLLETKNGKKTPKTEGVNVNYVELPNILVSGGTVNITTPTLKGTGSIVANSNPYVGISNSSNAWLRVNDIATKNAGNGIIFNDAKIADNSKIGGVKFSLNDSKKSGITIDNSGASTKNNGVPNIEIAGLIDASNRDVTIKNPNGDITVNASTNGKETGINGRTVNITSNGDLLHGYTSGTVHIGTAPEELYKKEVENGATRMGTVNNVDKGKGTYSDFKTGGARIMGGTVLISADNINVSGLIQSGFDTYKVTITQAEVDAAIKAAEAKDKSKQVIVGDRQLYKVNQSGTTWNNDYKAQDYVVQVYYDPQTKTLVAEDINRAGGKVYLAGNIISTGNGAIKAADGGADISIENYSNLPLEVGKVLNNNVEGEINILQVVGDKMSRYVYKNGTATVIDDYGDYLKNPSNDKIKTLSDAKTFKPTPETFYNWTVGNYITMNQHREVLQRAWNESAARKLVNDDNFLRSISEGKNKTARFLGAAFSRTAETSPLKSGTAVNVLKDAQKYDFKFGGDASVIDYKVLKRSFYRTERKLFKDNDYRIMWDEQLKYKGTYVASMRADYPIDIGFIGKKDGSITITGKGGVTLTDTIRNNSSGAKLSVNSSKDVTQKNVVDIYSNNANLEASGDLKGIKITALDEQKPVEFSAKTNGDIDATITGKVNLGDVKAKNVADLTATGDITQSGGKTVKSNRIDLTSKNGAVTANVETGRQTVDDDPLSASLNVSAYGNIDITQNQNDLRIGRIKSTTGDVKITAPSGRLIDALPGNANTLSGEDIDERIQKWIDTGMIAGADRNNAHIKSLERDVEAYEIAAKADFNYWQGIKDADRTKYTAAQNAVYDKYKKLFGSHSTVESYLAAQAANANSDYAKLKAEAANPTYKWTAEQLLYALDDAIVNRQTGSTDATEKLANITGKDVTITARSVGGVVKDTTITVEQLTGEDAIKYLKLLANANTANVEKILDADGKTQAFVIKGNEPVGIHATGTVNITYDASTKTPPENNNVALAVRKAEDNGSYSALNIGKINTIGAESTITILGKNGVKTVGSDSLLTAKSLFVEGGDGSIGTAENPLTVKLGDDGLTTARSEADIFIKSIGDNPLALGALYTPKNATLTANGFVRNTSKLLAAAYLDVGGKLTLNAGNNDIGTKENPLVIKNGIDSVTSTGRNIHLTSPKTSNPANSTPATNVDVPTTATPVTKNFNLIATKTASTANLMTALDAAKLATIANNGGMIDLRSGGSVYLDLSNNKGYYFPSTKEIIWNATL